MALALLLSGLWSCKLDDEGNQPVRNIYNFQKGVSLDPVKKEYSVGDIFWMEVDIPDKMMKDLVTNENIFISNATFNVILSSAALPFAPMPQTVARFDAVQQSGELVKGSTFETDAGANLRFGCPEDNYTLRVGLQLREEGNYILFLNKEEVTTLIFFTDDSDCSLQSFFPPPAEADLGNIFFTFDVEDNNLDVFDALVGSSTTQTLANYRKALENKTAFFISVR